MRKALISTIFFVSLMLSLSVSLLGPQSAQAATASDFNPGRIIDDGIFFNGENMTTDQVQSFISAKVSQCDTWGTQASTHYNGGAGRNYTRAEWGALNGNPAPYVCLKDYRMDVPNRAPDTYCKGAITGGNKSAAQILTDVSRACGVSPQVMLVLLQKEQGLLSDDWPWRDQYTKATGFACPDTADCDATYAGYFNQMYFGARQYQRYAQQASSFNYRAYNSPYVRYNPNASCGGSNLYIHSQSTAGLYNYTPYQPNQPALNNLYGTGDGCSAYGNRNFWRMFSDWFGSTKSFNANIIISQGLTTNVTNTAHEGQAITASYTVSNTADYEILAGGLGICARLNGANFDLGFLGHNPIPANSTKTISFTKTLTSPGRLQLFTCSYHASIGGWASSFYPYSSGNGAARTAELQVAGNPWIHTGVTLSPANPAAGQPVTATITIANASSSPLNIGTILVAARDKYGNNVDFPAEVNATIAGNSTYTYSKTQTFNTPGAHTFFIADLFQGVWRYDWPRTGSSSVVRKGSFNVNDNPLVTSSVTFSPASPAAGQPVTATVTIRNDSTAAVNAGLIVLAAREPSGANVDFPADPNVTIPASSTYTYTQTRTFNNPGSHSFFLANFRNNTWSTDYPKSASGSIVKSGRITVQDNPLITSNVTFTPTPLALNSPTTASFTIHNASASSVNIGTVLIAARDKNGYNADFPAAVNVTIPANTTYTYSQPRTMVTSGKYTYFVASFKNNTWSSAYPKSANGSLVRSGTFTMP